MDKVAFFVHADPDFFTLEDLRRYGGNINIIKDGERMEAMKSFSLGRVTLSMTAPPVSLMLRLVRKACRPQASSPSLGNRIQSSDILGRNRAHHACSGDAVDANGNVIDGLKSTRPTWFGMATSPFRPLNLPRKLQLFQGFCASTTLTRSATAEEPKVNATCVAKQCSRSSAK